MDEATIPTRSPAGRQSMKPNCGNPKLPSANINSQVEGVAARAATKTRDPMRNPTTKKGLGSVFWMIDRYAI